MGDVLHVRELNAALRERVFPSVTVWNRLEGRPRTIAFERALRAEVRDALWMLSRQWQLGEFHGEDAGSPVLAKLHLESTRLTRYRPGAHDPEAFDPAVPLETTVERRPPRFGLDVRLAIGRWWLKLIAPIGDYRQAYLDAYPVREPDPRSEDDAGRAAHPEVWQSYAAAAGRALDGGALLAHLRDTSSHRASDGIALLAAGDGDELDRAGARLLAWVARTFAEPDAEDAWEPPRMEYQFACSAPTGEGEKVLAAEEYLGGRLDWYAVDVDPAAGSLDPHGESPAELPGPGVTYTALPSPVAFDGMPNARWWAFEDGRTNLGSVDAATTDVAKLLFLEFALVYSNDWFVLPCTLEAGSVATVRGMAVTNVFGERTWIEPAGSGLDDDWQRWSMFTLSVRGEDDVQAADRSLLLLPTVPKALESEAVEEVLLVHDEMANMAWGVEQTVPLPDGSSRPGAEAALETRAFFERLRGGPPARAPFDTDATARYEAMSQIPEQWIPFMPVHVPGSNRQIQLQRSALPRFIEGDRFEPTGIVRPRTALLRPGLDGTRAFYYLNEEEVPRAGARVTQAWQRTRWRDGSVHLWLGARKGTGRLSGSSGLAFDQAVDVPPE